MAMINNTLYPPLMDTYQKAFLKDKSTDNKSILFNIQFKISEYTTITDIQTIEVKVSTLDGMSVLKGEHYFVKGVDVINTVSRTGSINILRSDTNIDSTGDIDFSYGSFYRIQLRVGKKLYEGQNGDSTTAIEAQTSFIEDADTLKNFSEWSTMSLIKCIDTPMLTIEQGNIVLKKINRVSDMSKITGYLKWKNGDNSEYLYSYRLRVYNVDDIPNTYSLKEPEKIFEDIKPLEDSGVKRALTASPNRLEYVFRTDFSTSDRYRIFFSYETENKYEQTVYSTFYVQNTINSSNLADNNAVLSLYPNSQKGGIEVGLSLDRSYLSIPSAYLIFRRSSSENNFTLWDDIHTVKLTKENIVEKNGKSILQYVWTDWTAENGVFYKYCVQEVDIIGNRAEKIIGKYHENIDDFYKSLLECHPYQIDGTNLLNDIDYSFDTDISNSFWDGGIKESGFSSKEFEIQESSYFKYETLIKANKNIDIDFEILDIRTNKIIKQDILHLVSNEELHINMNFNLDAGQIIKFNFDLVNLDSATLSQLKIIFGKMFLYQYKQTNLPHYKDTQYVILDADSSYIMNKDNVLKLGFDTNISSITKTRKDTITETLNSKYPFIYRSGKVEYDSYNIEGTISILGDMYVDFNILPLQDSLTDFFKDIYIPRMKMNGNENVFKNQQELFKFNEIYEMYQIYAENNNLSVENDFNIEKLFRQQAETFLSDGTPKLFKNAGLGNKIVVLTDVSLTPKETLNGYVYAFSATMTELDDNTVNNYSFYNIINLLNYQNGNNYNKQNGKKNIVEDKILGQYSYIPFDYYKTEKNALLLTQDILQELKYKYYFNDNNEVTELQYLTKIKIDLSKIERPMYPGTNVLGTVILNDKEFIISQNNPILSLSNVYINTNFTITTSKFDNHEVIIDYLGYSATHVIYNTKDYIRDVETRIGQIFKTFDDTNADIYKEINYTYAVNSNIETRSVLNLQKLLIQAYIDKNNFIPLSDVMISLKDELTGIDVDDKLYEYRTDFNGIIDLYDQDRIIKGLQYKGVKVSYTTQTNPKINEYTNIDTNIYVTEDDLYNNNLLHPTNNTLYLVGQPELAFLYNDSSNLVPLDYEAEADLENHVLNVTIDPGSYSSSNVANFISNHLGDEETIDAILDTINVEKYFYFNNHFYKVNDDNIAQLPVDLKVTFLYDLKTIKEVS